MAADVLVRENDLLDKIVESADILYETADVVLIHLDLRRKHAEYIGVSGTTLYFSGCEVEIVGLADGKWHVFADTSRYTCVVTLLRHDLFVSSREVYDGDADAWKRGER